MKLTNTTVIDDWLQVKTTDPNLMVLLSKLLPVISEYGNDFIRLIKALGNNDILLSKAGEVPDKFKSIRSLMEIDTDTSSTDMTLFFIKLLSNLALDNTDARGLSNSEIMLKASNFIGDLSDHKSALENLNLDEINDTNESGEDIQSHYKKYLGSNEQEHSQALEF